MKKSPAQLQREIDEALRSPTVRAAAPAVQRGGGGYVMAADRAGAGDRPKTFPKRLQHGLYTATFKGINERFPGDPLASAHWKITRRGKEVGTMHEGSAYGWGRPTSTPRQLVWGGVQPPGASDSRTSEYGLTFDQGPADGYAEALAKFAKAADRLIEWRQKHGHPAMGFARGSKAKRATVQART
jgi:hypothetical protein